MKRITFLMSMALLFIFGSAVAAEAESRAYLPPEGKISQQIKDTVPPANFQTAFTARFPNATAVRWYRYAPPQATVEPGLWYSVLDENDYYAIFTIDGDRYIAWFDNGRWIRTSRSIDEDMLPEAVVRSIRSMYPGYTITDVDLETEDRRTVYEVDLENGHKKFEVTFTPAGAVLKTKDKTRSVARVMDEISLDFSERYPDAVDVVWYRYVPRDHVYVLPDDWDYTMDVNDYEVRYVIDGIPYTAWYDDGRWLRSEAISVNAAMLPQAIVNAINRDYPGFVIKDIDYEVDNNRSVYEVEMERGDEKCKIHYLADGNITKSKCKNGTKVKIKNK